uniref:Uncharacterized protein n=1 Tax=Calidris pygmaea TaxID=425635 RepID=A0A8C3KG32_9CHAR
SLLACFLFFARLASGDSQGFTSSGGYLNELKEDDSLCRQAQASGTFYLFHNLSPFLQKVGKKYLVPQLGAAEMKKILETSKETEQWIEKSVLIGCSDEHVPHFALDLGWDNTSSTCVSRSCCKKGLHICQRKVLKGTMPLTLCQKSVHLESWSHFTDEMLLFLWRESSKETVWARKA